MGPVQTGDFYQASLNTHYGKTPGKFVHEGLKDLGSTVGSPSSLAHAMKAIGFIQAAGFNQLHQDLVEINKTLTAQKQS